MIAGSDDSAAKSATVQVLSISSAAISRRLNSQTIIILTRIHLSQGVSQLHIRCPKPTLIITHTYKR